jgi:hypothetical protein
MPFFSLTLVSQEAQLQKKNAEENINASAHTHTHKIVLVLRDHSFSPEELG